MSEIIILSSKFNARSPLNRGRWIKASARHFWLHKSLAKQQQFVFVIFYRHQRGMTSVPKLRFSGLWLHFVIVVREKAKFFTAPSYFRQYFNEFCSKKQLFRKYLETFENLWSFSVLSSLVWSLKFLKWVGNIFL